MREITDKQHAKLIKIADARYRMARSIDEINRDLGGLTNMEWLDVFLGNNGLISDYIDKGR